MFKEKIRTILGAFILSALSIGMLEFFIANFLVWMPNRDGIEYYDLLLLSIQQPLSLIYAVSSIDLFVQLQVFFALGFILLFNLFFKLLKGSVYKEAAAYGSHGTARFATPREVFDNKTFVKKTWNHSAKRNMENSPGLIFGLLKDKPVILPENTKIPNRNVFIVGSPGSGKTQSYILTNVIFERDRSMVITDPKGEIYEATAKLKKEQGYEVRLINFKEMTISDRYNPLDYIETEIDAEQVATTIVMNAQKDTKSNFWTKAEIALLKTLLLYVKYECPNEATMYKVKEILTVHGKKAKEMDEFFSHLNPDHPAYQAYQIVRMAEGTVRSDIFVSLAMTLSKFDAKDVRWFTRKSDFKLDDIGQRKIILYCILPVADPTWEPLTSMFFSQMFQRLYKVADRNFNRLPVSVNFLLDEFPNLGSIPGYEEILATCRSYGISISTIVQSIGQLVDKYNKEKAEAIIGNCALRYLLGVGDKLTAEYFSKLIGETTIQMESTSLSKNSRGGTSGSISSSYTGRPLLTPDELTRLDKEEAILLVSGMLPIRLRKAFQFSFFKGILNNETKVSRFDYIKLKGEDSKSLMEIDRENAEMSLEDYIGQLDDLEEENMVEKKVITEIDKEIEWIEKELDDLLNKLDQMEIETDKDEDHTVVLEEEDKNVKKKKKKRRKKKKKQKSETEEPAIESMGEEEANKQKGKLLEEKSTNDQEKENIDGEKVNKIVVETTERKESIKQEELLTEEEQVNLENFATK
ncbi:VirD4-like conjugal transfer protein, CD1115 family [Thermoflavimicrobium dichotomicum]|uniref:Type IV secretion system protein VirD4 n=1 Tax=Thermoflavimicrobium dichotomicum TaxID=46223 RepID=A0A1I3K671_9BACL|nr:type IV secretory system conjugative DNA transfer family protein [Thermoflavimicrobium dichotomicum]SFI67936.1 type IV secretion system protein VirD4 [Thermoflavimicrobium dichotomicum]